MDKTKNSKDDTFWGEFIEILYPYFVKKLKSEAFFKNVLRRKNATVVAKGEIKSFSQDEITYVSFPYDDTSFGVINKTGDVLNQGDLVCIDYWIDLKNAVAVYKVNS